MPSKSKLSFIKSCDFRVVAPVAFEQASFHLDCKFLELERWVGSIVVTKELIDKYEPQIFRDLRKRISRFTDAGWSFSSFGGIKRIREKIESFVMRNIINKNIKMKIICKNVLKQVQIYLIEKLRKKK